MLNGQIFKATSTKLAPFLSSLWPEDESYKCTSAEDYTPKGLKTRAQNSDGLLLKQDMYRGMFGTFVSSFFVFGTFVSNFFTFNFQFHSNSFIQR